MIYFEVAKASGSRGTCAAKLCAASHVMSAGIHMLHNVSKGEGYTLMI